jgi:hypothetical protein
MVDFEKLSDADLEMAYVELNCEFQRRKGISIHKEKPKFKEEPIAPLPAGFDIIKKMKESKIRVFMPSI